MNLCARFWNQSVVQKRWDHCFRASVFAKVGIKNKFETKNIFELSIPFKLFKSHVLMWLLLPKCLRPHSIVTSIPIRKTRKNAKTSHAGQNATKMNSNAMTKLVSLQTGSKFEQSFFLKSC